MAKATNGLRKVLDGGGLFAGIELTKEEKARVNQVLAEDIRRSLGLEDKEIKVGEKTGDGRRR